MHKIFWVLCLILYPAIAGATNFEACIYDAKQNNKVTAATGYTLYKCEGSTAEKLSARPDECPAGNVRPPFASLNRNQTQLSDGLSATVKWTAGKCTGACELRSYDSKDATFTCEVRIYSDGTRPPDANPDPPPDRQTTDESRRRWPRLGIMRPPRYADRPGHAGRRAYRYRSPYYTDRARSLNRPPYYPERPDFRYYSGRRLNSNLRRDYSGPDYPPPNYSDRPYDPFPPPVYPDWPDFLDPPAPFTAPGWPEHPVPPENVPPRGVCGCWR